MKLTTRGKVVAYLALLTTIYILGHFAGSWELSEICLVEGVGCPENLNR